MTDTPNIADDCMKILDNENAVIVFRNPLGIYTAAVLKHHRFSIEDLPESCIADDLTPSKAIHRLTEKFTTGRIAGESTA